jgi:hypothetical protein
VFYLCLSNMGKGLTGVISVLYWSMDNDPDSILCLIQAVYISLLFFVK